MAVYKNAWTKLSTLTIRHKSAFVSCCEDFVNKIILGSLFIFGINLKPCPAFSLLKFNNCLMFTLEKGLH